MSTAPRIVVLPGDGIGPEIVAATTEVLDAADRRFKLGLTYQTADIGFAALRACGTTIPDGVVERAKQAAGVILGPVSHNEYPPVAEGGLNRDRAERQIEVMTAICGALCNMRETDPHKDGAA